MTVSIEYAVGLGNWEADAIGDDFSFSIVSVSRV